MTKSVMHLVKEGHRGLGHWPANRRCYEMFFKAHNNQHKNSNNQHKNNNNQHNNHHDNQKPNSLILGPLVQVSQGPNDVILQEVNLCQH